MSTAPTRKLHAANQRGFTMIEALVTFVILAIGLLGIVSLMTTSKTSQYEAVQRARAVTMADNLVERIRENPRALSSYDTGLTPVSIGSEPSPDCDVAVCDPNELATHDLWAWQQLLEGTAVTYLNEDSDAVAAGGLTDPQGCVLFTPFAGRQNTGSLVVLVQWRGLLETVDGVAAGGQACGGQTADTDPNRRQIRVSSFVVDGSEL